MVVFVRGKKTKRLAKFVTSDITKMRPGDHSWVKLAPGLYFINATSASNEVALLKRAYLQTSLNIGF
jgi:hypothetical protein